ncbi:hypothetical protein P167DRAFT_253545 [Morchella conica CCBAS932]|uniref:Secreted protein n=1 Tax=Morchella conica CCBAS932 TaxID=1392247 RepID=A0A3N4KM13_9PEZI|nr:hypothetical protein P167DRAFT_253545 [Morchella conica CCBAS932]
MWLSILFFYILLIFNDVSEHDCYCIPYKKKSAKSTLFVCHAILAVSGNAMKLRVHIDGIYGGGGGGTSWKQAFLMQVQWYKYIRHEGAGGFRFRGLSRDLSTNI